MKKVTKKEIINNFHNLKGKNIAFVCSRYFSKILELESVISQIDIIINNPLILDNWNKKEKLEILEKSNYLLLNNSRLDLTNCEFFTYKDFIIVNYKKYNEILVYKEI